jgi:hypothetical protein
MREAQVSRSIGTVTAAIAGVAAAVLVAAMMLAVAPRPAAANPEFAKQTKKPCGQCHVSPAGGKELKPFGQKFKDNGYKL